MTLEMSLWCHIILMSKSTYMYLKFLFKIYMSNIFTWKENLTHFNICVAKYLIEEQRQKQKKYNLMHKQNTRLNYISLKVENCINFQINDTGWRCRILILIFMIKISKWGYFRQFHTKLRSLKLYNDNMKTKSKNINTDVRKPHV